MSSLHGEYRENKHRMKYNCSHKNKQIKWEVDKILLESEDSYLLKQSKPKRAFPMEVTEARKH